MLLQSHTGIVHVFPAVPASWKDISFRTLRTEGAFLVSATREKGACTRVEITAEKGGTLRLADPFAEGPDMEILEFQMEEGESLLLGNN
jgi:alpha-L-fucosidase 2